MRDFFCVVMACHDTPSRFRLVGRNDVGVNIMAWLTCVLLYYGLNGSVSKAGSNQLTSFYLVLALDKLAVAI